MYEKDWEAAVANPVGPGPAHWIDDLSPIAPADWSYDRAAHLLERAAFGGTPDDVERFALMTPATGNFRDLLIGVARDPAMLAFLDAGVNVKGAPNENFAREIMELFTLGVGHYGEADIREAAP